MFWDELTKVHGREPTEIALYVSEGGFRDWHIRIGDDDYEFEDAFIGTPSLVDPIFCARSTAPPDPHSMKPQGETR